MADLSKALKAHALARKLLEGPDWPVLMPQRTTAGFAAFPVRAEETVVEDLDVIYILPDESTLNDEQPPVPSDPS